MYILCNNNDSKYANKNYKNRCMHMMLYVYHIRVYAIPLYIQPQRTILHM